MEHVDLVIVGAGINVICLATTTVVANLETGLNGLSTAKTYLDVNPSANALILDGAKTVGGVWAEERLYPGLKTNNVIGTYEFSDFPLTERFGVKPGQHLPGSVVHRYLCEFAEAFDLTRRIRLCSQVKTAELKAGKHWVLTISDSKSTESPPIEMQLSTDQLVVATGLTSEPFLPKFEGAAQFNAPLYHVKYFHDRAKDDVKNVVVYGTSKSAYDTCYPYAINDVQVHWIERKSGNGPTWMATPYVTPFKILLQKLVLTRFLTWFSPSIFDSDGYGWIRHFLDKTWLGRKLVKGFWSVLGNDVVELMGYDKHSQTTKLKPRNEPFWTAGTLSINNYDMDILELVRKGKIRVYTEDVTRLSDHAVHLSNGARIHADAFICCTGWKRTPSINFLPCGIDVELGLPHYAAKPPPLSKKADDVVLSRFPRLTERPLHNPQYNPHLSIDEYDVSQKPNQPYRLYRFMVPSSPALFNARTIAFAGAYSSIGTCLVAQAQALWITAYLTGELPSLSTKTGPSDKSREWTTILHSQFGKWRHPACAGGYGETFPDMAFDSLPYLDLLLSDLDLKSHRKSGWFWREWFTPYGQEDYKDLVGEWNQVQEKTKMKVEPKKEL